MSHEIRTPLNGILGMASLLTDADLTTKQEEMVSIIRDSGTALLQILNDVLDFSKIEAGKLLLAEAPFEVRGLAADCMRSVETSARQKSIFTGFSVAPNVSPWLFGDALTPDGLQEQLSRWLSAYESSSIPSELVSTIR